MPEERLLERIAHLEDTEYDDKLTRVERELNSVILHLQRMLNTRQGSVPTALDYGIPDFTNFPGEMLQETGSKMEKIIKKTILKYEPRLQNIKIIFDIHPDDVLALRFKLDALLLSDRKVPVVFETVLTSSGKCNIHR
ncbi:type VI secretion system baseplate subunit TssE [candidate division CSSED10-310 bacterium]|uniref:Type VI secretion system baseplate subunit TssE n=1 Tax=candidate division CSSED10-310 bacterium TaxID=2855610 RepID=A0ABV6Z1W9_UNCC1